MRVVHSFLHEQTQPVDQLHIWLNGYFDVANADLPQNERIVYHLESANPGPWVRYQVTNWITDDESLVLTLDDDTLYPSEYVAVGARKLALCDQATAACFTGILWDPLVKVHSYYENRWQSVAEKELLSDQAVALHQGQTGFFRAGLIRNAVNFALPGFKTNDDMMIGYALQQRGAKTICFSKPPFWLRDTSVSDAKHALYRRDVKTRSRTFQQMIKLGFDPTAGQQGALLSYKDRVLVIATPPNQEQNLAAVHREIAPLCVEDATVHILMAVPLSGVDSFRLFSNKPYFIHAVGVPESGGRFNDFWLVHTWRDWRVRRSGSLLWRARVKNALKRLQPTITYQYRDGVLYPLSDQHLASHSYSLTA